MTKKIGRPQKTARNKLLIKLVEERGVVNAAKDLGLAKSTVSELYRDYKHMFGNVDNSELTPVRERVN